MDRVHALINQLYQQEKVLGALVRSDVLYAAGETVLDNMHYVRVALVSEPNFDVYSDDINWIVEQLQNYMEKPRKIVGRHFFGIFTETLDK